MLLIAYRTDAATLSSARLLAWCRTVVVNGMASVTPPGAVVTLTPPSVPWSFERQRVADDRRSRGGHLFSRINYTARRGTWSFNDIDEAEAPAWRAWHEATEGGRLPFVIEFREARYVIEAPGDFPLEMVKSTGKLAGSFDAHEVLR